jgi:hypothetical protein
VGDPSELKAEIDRTPWDAPDGTAKDQVFRFPYSGEARLLEFIDHACEKRFRGALLRDWVGYGWTATYYFGGMVVVVAMLLPAALLLALLFRRLSRRKATMATGLIFLGSVVGLSLWAAPHAETVKRLKDVRQAAPENLAPALADPAADVRYEAVFRVYMAMDESRENIERSSRDPSALKDALARHEKLATALGDALRAALKDPDVRVRVWAVGALGRLGAIRNNAELDAVVAALSDDFFVRYRAAGALGDIGAYQGNLAFQERIDQQVVPELIRMMQEEPWYVGSYALNALRRMRPDAGY